MPHAFNSLTYRKSNNHSDPRSTVKRKNKKQNIPFPHFWVGSDLCQTLNFGSLVVSNDANILDKTRGEVNSMRKSDRAAGNRPPDTLIRLEQTVCPSSEST